MTKPIVHTVICMSLDRDIDDEIEIEGGLERQALATAAEVFKTLHDYRGLVFTRIKNREVMV